MPKYTVTAPYWFTLSATVEANSREEALTKFDEVPTDECREDYKGLLDSYDVEVFNIDTQQHEE